MIKDSIPLEVDPRRLAERNALLEGWIKLADFTRLAAHLLVSTGEVWAQFEFGRDAGKYCTVKGHIKADLPMQCQRCMGEMVLNVDIQTVFSPIADEKRLENLPAGYEPLALPLGEVISLPALVEDELLLSLPLVPKHDPAVCPVKLKASEDSQTQPFAVLANLKNKA